MNETDWGPLIVGAGAALAAFAAYLRISGKWAEWRLTAAMRKEAGEQQARDVEQGRADRLEAEVNRLVAEKMADRDARVTKLEEVNRQHHEEINRLTTATATLTSENQQYRNSLSTLEKALAETNKEHEVERSGWHAQRESLERDLETLRGRVGSLESELARKDNELDVLRSDMKTYKERFREMELSNARLEAKNGTLEEANRTLAALVERSLSTLSRDDPRVIGGDGHSAGTKQEV